jgi:hypothetical protein
MTVRHLRVLRAVVICLSLGMVAQLGTDAPAYAAYGMVNVSPAYLALCSDPLLPTTDNSYELTGILTGPVAPESALRRLANNIKPKHAGVRVLSSAIWDGTRYAASAE